MTNIDLLFRSLLNVSKNQNYRLLKNLNLVVYINFLVDMVRFVTRLSALGIPKIVNFSNSMPTIRLVE